MSGGTMRPDGYVNRSDELAGWTIRVTSYRLGERYYAVVQNADPGAQVARAAGESREDAERRALQQARERLSGARGMPIAEF